MYNVVLEDGRIIKSRTLNSAYFLARNVGGKVVRLMPGGWGTQFEYAPVYMLVYALPTYEAMYER